VPDKENTALGRRENRSNAGVLLVRDRNGTVTFVENRNDGDFPEQWITFPASFEAPR
jgi:hypothetical protein